MNDGHRAHWLGSWDDSVVWGGTWAVEPGAGVLGGTLDMTTLILQVYGGELASLRSPTVIYGTCSGIEITLFDCYHSSVDDTGGVIQAQNIHVGWAIIGEHLTSEQRIFDGASWRHPHLEPWASREPLTPAGDPWRPDGFEHVLHQSLAATLEHGEVRLVQCHSQRQPTRYQVIAQGWEVFEARFREPLSLGEVLNQWVVPLDRLVNLCVGLDREFYQLRVRRGDTWLDVHLRSSSREPTGEMLHGFQVALPLSAVDFAVLVETWLPIHSQLTPVCATLFSPATNDLPPYPRFMALAAAADGLVTRLGLVPRDDQGEKARRQEWDQRRARVLEALDDPSDKSWVDDNLSSPNPTFVRQLEALRDLPGPEFSGLFMQHFGPGWPAIFKTVRHAYAHTNHNIERYGDVQVEFMATTLKLLIRVALLVEIGISGAKLREALGRDKPRRDLMYSYLVKQEPE